MILLLTHSEDFYTIDLVKDSLASLGADSLRVNMDSFPTELRLSQFIAQDGRKVEMGLGESRLDTSLIQAVWMRKYWPPRISPSIDPDFRDGSFRESKEALDIFLHSLSHLPCIDPLWTVQKANNKFFQLEAAKAAGIRVPRTLITNDPERMKEFYRKAGTGVIAKMLTQLQSSMNGTSFFVYTSKVTEDHLEDADMLTDCPMTFQEYVEKDHELRIIYIDGEFYTGKIDASASMMGKVDWRKSQPGEVSWEHSELPVEIKEKLSGLMGATGLVYGAIDMIFSTEGEYVFLEVNPTGEWGMLQRDLGLPISDAIARALIKRIRS
jgi:glutathione synthase/RimK-type ligase-like ATP-grasp enzyme